MDTVQVILEFFPVSLFGSLVVGLVLPLIGALVFLRRMVFLGVAVPQFSAAGLSLGMLLLPLFPAMWEEHLHHGHPPMAYMFTFALLAAGLALWIFAWLEARDRHGSVQGRLAAGFVIATALALLFLTASRIGANLLESLVRGGQLLMLDLHGLYIALGVFLLVLLGLVRWRRAILLVAFDKDAAIAQGINVARIEWLMMFLVGLAVAGGVMTVGPVLVYGLLFLPPLAARQVAENMRSFLTHCALVGLASVLLAWPASVAFDQPYGPGAVISGALLVALYRLIGRRGQRQP